MAEQMDLDIMSRTELTELRTQLDKAIAAAGERDRQRALKAAEDVVREHGFTLADLAPQGGRGGSRGKRAAGAKAGAAPSPAAAEVRFRNPEDPSQTWSGRGRRPAWYSEALAAGRPIETLKAG